MLGAGEAFFSVSPGAFGAHACKPMLGADLQAAYDTAVRYQMYHLLALLGPGVLVTKHHHRNLLVADWFFVWGIVPFSGSLYGLALTQAMGGVVTRMG